MLFSSLTFKGLSFTFSSSLNSACCGAVAQLGERLNGIQEVVGSTPIGSTKKSITWTPLKFSPCRNCARTVPVIGCLGSFHYCFRGDDDRHNNRGLRLLPKMRM